MREWFDTLQRREQVLVSTAAVVAIATAIYLFALEPVMVNHERSEIAVERKERLIASADRLIASRGGTPVAGASTGAGGSLTLIVANTANANGLSNAYRSSSPTANDGIRVNFENAAFDDLVRWLGILANAHGLRVTQARMTDRSETGRVDASLVLQRG
ncbi:MAG: type II secretion system protein GspM [Pseudomonadota bacterium]